MTNSEIITTGSAVPGSLDITDDDPTTLVTADDGWVEIVAPAALGRLGELSVQVPTDALRALLRQLDHP